MNKPAPITTRRFDMRDHGIGRTIRQDIRFRYLPFGHFGGGPSVFLWAQLALLHVFGGAALRVSYALEGNRVIRWLWRLGKRRGNPRA